MLERKYQDEYINILKILLPFLVVMCHFYDNDTSHVILAELRAYAVPIFLCISFYLVADKLGKCESDFYRKRILRLYLPCIFWGGLYYVINSIINVIVGTNVIPFKELFLQLAMGHSEKIGASQFWFLYVQIWILFMFFCIYKYFYNSVDVICLTLLLICLVAQISSINYDLFINLPYFSRYPLGRFAEMVPYAVLGIYLRKYANTNSFNGFRYIIATIIAMLWYILRRRGINFPGFGYSGLQMFLGTIVIMSFIKSTFIEKIIVGKIKDIVHFFSRYSLGVFCLHNIVGHLIERFDMVQMRNSFDFCILIYVICIGICVILDKLPVKWIKIMIT